jgi:hypothetical protein
MSKELTYFVLVLLFLPYFLLGSPLLFLLSIITLVITIGLISYFSKEKLSEVVDQIQGDTGAIYLLVLIFCAWVINQFFPYF